jgi:hypothetical protein
MTISSSDIQKALKISRVVKEYFENTTESKVQAKELMSYFIEKGIFISNSKDGLPIRDFLRHVDENNHLHLIREAFFEQKDVNKNWYFIKSKK